jgi:hypothetical protein
VGKTWLIARWPVRVSEWVVRRAGLMMMESDWNCGVGEKDDHTASFAYQPSHSINGNHNHNVEYQQSREVEMD